MENWKREREEELKGNLKGNETGEFTYIEKRGATIIDYVMSNNTRLSMIEKFYVGDKIDSDYPYA